MKRFFLLLLLGSLTAFAADNEPRTVAESAFAAWNSADAAQLDAICHPELKKRFREARIVNFYVEDKADKKRLVTTGSDSEVIKVLCEALKLIVGPYPPELERFNQYVDTRYKGDLAIVTFESGYKRRSDGKIGMSSKTETVLKKDGKDWKFLWSGVIQIHIDLEWNPLE